MKQNIEKEYKIGLDKQGYDYLRQNFKNQIIKVKSQENYYFDTFDCKLDNENCVLRVRNESKNYEITFKNKAKLEDGALKSQESNKEISENDFFNIKKNPAYLFTFLPMLEDECPADKNNIILKGQVKNVRTIIFAFQAKLELDKTIYNFSDCDYELEIENIPFEIRKKILDYLVANNINHTDKISSKYKRFLARNN